MEEKPTKRPKINEDDGDVTKTSKSTLQADDDVLPFSQILPDIYLGGSFNSFSFSFSFHFFFNYFSN